MRRYNYCTTALAAVLWVSLFVATALGGLTIPFEKWQPNQTPGYCMWVSIKTLLLQHGWDDVAARILEDETKLGGGERGWRHEGNGPPREVILPAGGGNTYKAAKRFETYAEKYGLQYEIMNGVNTQAGQRPTRKHVDFVRDACDKGYGVAVSTMKGMHAVTLIDVTKDPITLHYPDGTKREGTGVEWIDCNDVEHYYKDVAEYKAGRRPNMPAKPKTHLTSLDWWVENSWDGSAVVIKPNPNQKDGGDPVTRTPQHLRNVQPKAPVIAPTESLPRNKPTPNFPRAQPQEPIVVPFAVRPKD